MASEFVEVPVCWAIVSLLGHKTYAGRITEEERFGSKLGRIDVPDGDGFLTVYFGGSSVYSIQPVSEAVARDVAKRNSPAPVSSWDYPKQLTAPVSHREQDKFDQPLFDEVDPDECETCGCRECICT